MVLFFRFYKGIQIKYFHVCLIIKEILLLLGLKIIRAEFGEISLLGDRKVSKNDENILIICNLRYSSIQF